MYWFPRLALYFAAFLVYFLLGWTLFLPPCMLDGYQELGPCCTVSIGDHHSGFNEYDACPLMLNAVPEPRHFALQAFTCRQHELLCKSYDYLLFGFNVHGKFSVLNSTREIHHKHKEKQGKRLNDSISTIFLLVGDPCQSWRYWTGIPRFSPLHGRRTCYLR